MSKSIFHRVLCAGICCLLCVSLTGCTGSVDVLGKDSGVTLSALCGRLVSLGLTGVIVTDIAKDGAMGGSNLELYRRLGKAFPRLKVTASGGVSSHEDLAALRGAGCWGAIVGKAYYTGAVDLRRAIEENT